MEKQIEVRSQLRIPAKLHIALNKEAYKAKRSMNAEIVERLERSLTLDTDVGQLQTRANAIHVESIAIGVADLRDSVTQVLKQMKSERALIRSLALAVVTSADLAKKRESDEVPKAATDTLQSLKNLAAQFLDSIDDGSHRHVADDWHAK
jgi:hypothetical protein